MASDKALGRQADESRPGADVAILELPRPDDFHVHLRQGPPLAAYAARSARHFGRALAMPNTLPPIASGRSLGDYRRAVLAGMAGYACAPLFAFKLLPGMGAAAVRDCAAAGAVSGKYYPVGSTTNAADGVPSPEAIAEELAAMEELGLILSVHAEDPARPVMEREEAFLPVLDRVIGRYPGLKLIMEHVSSAAGIEAIMAWPDRVAATITAHHLSFTIDDLLGERFSPSFYCKPVLKAERDRAAIREAASSGSPKFFFGSDSAPHPPRAKAAGAAGCYAAPTALALLAEAFEELGRLDALASFTSRTGAAFYGLPPAEGLLRLERSPWRVPALMDGTIPLAAGRTLRWRVVE